MISIWTCSEGNVSVSSAQSIHHSQMISLLFLDPIFFRFCKFWPSLPLHSRLLSFCAQMRTLCPSSHVQMLFFCAQSRMLSFPFPYPNIFLFHTKSMVSGSWADADIPSNYKIFAQDHHTSTAKYSTSKWDNGVSLCVWKQCQGIVVCLHTKRTTLFTSLK